MLTGRHVTSALAFALVAVGWPTAAMAADPSPGPIKVGTGDGIGVVTTVTDPGHPGSSGPSVNASESVTQSGAPCTL